MPTATKTRLHPSHIDIPESKREELIALLNQQLADNADLVSQLKQAHWNVKGSTFMMLHELFDEAYEALTPFVDMIAERATTLGGTAMGTVRMASKASTLKEYPADIHAGHDHLEAVRDRIAAYAASTRKAIGTSEDLGDPTTADLFTEASRAVDLQLYFVEQHLDD